MFVQMALKIDSFRLFLYYADTEPLRDLKYTELSVKSSQFYSDPTILI